MATHKALGRGLSALFSDSKVTLKEMTPAKISELAQNGQIKEISVNSIRPNRSQPRVQFDDDSLQELAASIKQHGIQQPLVVTESAQTGEFELVVGERRLRASKLAGLATVPCLIKKMSTKERLVVALIENLQREDLNAYDEAVALRKLMQEYSLTQEEASDVIGKSRSSVANILRLLKLNEKVLDALKINLISEGHAKCLAGVLEESKQLHFLNLILKNHLSVRELEILIASQSKKKKSKGSPVEASSPETRKFIEDFQRILGRRVEIQSQGKKGWLKFAFYSPWDLELLCKKLGLLDTASGQPKDPV